MSSNLHSSKKKIEIISVNSQWKEKLVSQIILLAAKNTENSFRGQHIRSCPIIKSHYSSHMLSSNNIILLDYLRIYYYSVDVPISWAKPNQMLCDRPFVLNSWEIS